MSVFQSSSIPADHAVSGYPVHQFKLGLVAYLFKIVTCCNENAVQLYLRGIWSKSAGPAQCKSCIE